MSDTSIPEEPTGSCPVCWRRDALRPQVCWPCRSWLAGLLGDLRILAEQLATGDLDADDDRQAERRVGDWRRVLAGGGVNVLRWCDPVAAVIPAGPIPAAPAGPRGTNPPESRPPVALDALDLTSAAQQGSRAPAARGALGDADQSGHLPLATALETWAVEWAHQRGEHRPTPAVDVLTRWLADRLEWACDEYEDIGSFAGDLSIYRRVLRTATGLNDRPEYKTGVPCPRCDQLALYRRNGSEWIECGNCEAMMSADEYRQWTVDLAKPDSDAA